MKRLLNKIYGLDSTFVIFFSLSIATSVLSYLYQVFLGNKMELADYGVFNSLNSLCSNLMCLFSPLSVLMCREMAGARGRFEIIRPIWDRTIRVAKVISVIILIVISLFFLLEKLNGSMKWSICALLLVAIAVISGGFYGILNGTLQGAGRLEVYGAAGFAAVIIKLIVSAAGILIHNNAYIPVGAMIVSNVSSIIVIYLFLTRFNRCRNDEVELKERTIGIPGVLELYGITFIANFLLSPYINGGEIILMSTEYDDELVGLYSLAITIAKASIYIISIFTAALLPKFALLKENGIEVCRKYLALLLMCFIFGCVWIVGLSTVGIRIIPCLFGAGYYEALLNLKYMALWVVCMGMLLAANTYYLAINRLKRFILALGIGSVVALMVIKVIKVEFWTSPMVLGGVGAGIVVWSVIDTFIQMTRRPKI